MIADRMLECSIDHGAVSLDAWVEEDGVLRVCTSSIAESVVVEITPEEAIQFARELIDMVYKLRSKENKQ